MHNAVTPEQAGRLLMRFGCCYDRNHYLVLRFISGCQDQLFVPTRIVNELSGVRYYSKTLHRICMNLSKRGLLRRERAAAARICVPNRPRHTHTAFRLTDEGREHLRILTERMEDANVTDSLHRQGCKTDC